MADSAMCELGAQLTVRLLNRNPVSRRFFDVEADRLAVLARDMASRFARGGRLFAFGVGSGVSDAQHVAVEFVHPVVVGKRALPAIDVSASYRAWVATGVGSDDIVIGFDPSAADRAAASALERARARGALTCALSGPTADYAIDVIDADPFIHQEIVEIVYHVMWETVHVFLEHSALGHDAGPAAFLYPFLGSSAPDTTNLAGQVAGSIRAKAAADERLREQVAREGGDTILSAVRAIRSRLASGGTLLMIGNGGSATDATDCALDCVDSPKGYAPIPALSLAADAATLTALANDIGQESVFLRQIVAYARPSDVLVVMTTSGGSANVVAALAEARQRGLLTVALAGYDGGEIARRTLADFTVVVPSDYTPRIQEIHASVYHVMIDLLSTFEPMP